MPTVTPISVSEKFALESDKKAFDSELRRKINFNIGKYDAAVTHGLSLFQDHELARARASHIKADVVANLDKYLVEFEKNFTANGGKIIWANDDKDALKAIFDIIRDKKARTIVKSKTMTSEEIELNEHLEKAGVDVVETDLGEYIVQLRHEKPYHIVTPAMHLSKKDISELFHKKLNMPLTDDAQLLTLKAREILREKYLKAEIGITGGNFLIADIGGIAVTENEGNARMSTAFPKTHIAIVGIEKILPSINDMDLFWSMLSTSGTGQQVMVYNTIFTGPKKKTEKDGPDEMYLILLDNGRSKLLADAEKRQALQCIRCGACLNTCPVYKNIGGHTYNSTYSGPIGSIITPHFKGMEQFKHLSFASSLCGSCTSVCPVKIDIHNILLLNRKESVESGLFDKYEKIGFDMWKAAMKSRTLMDLPTAGMKNFMLRYLFKNSWEKRRSLPQIAKKSFKQLWEERGKG
jgi:L-lactate dehydrogenase complex protein LldF